MAAPLRLADVIRTQRDEIIRRWEKAVRALPHASTLDRPRLIDHIPALLERIARMTEELGQGAAPTAPRTAAELHALARLDEGYDILEVIAEFRVLRDVVFQVFHAPQGDDLQVDDTRVLNAAIDTAIIASVGRYSDIRERTLRGFDQIAVAAVESANLDELLKRLLRVLRDTTPAIDTSSIELRDGDVLRVRAAVGMGREREVGLAIRVGEGIAGAIAASGQPVTIHAPAPGQVASPVLAGASLRVLHGVPIFDHGRVIGTATIGSATADDFSQQDQRIFAAMVARATAAILQHVLREQGQHATEQLGESERQFRALADNIPQLAWMTDASGSTYWQNRRWYDYTGTSPDSSRGWGWQDMVHPEHLARVLERWRAALDRGCAWEDTFPIRGHDGRYRWFLSRAVPIRDEHGAIERWFGTNTDVTARRLLERAATLLAGSLDYRATLEQLARLAVPELADWCLVDLLEDGRLEHLAIAHADARGLDLVTAYARAHPPDLATEQGTREVLHTGQVRIVPDVTDEILGRITDQERLRALRELDVHSWIGAPLLARGATLGVLHLVMSGSNRRYGAAEVELASELAQRAGTAVDNARLYRDAQRAVRAREDVLAIVSHDLRNPLASIDLGATMLLQRPNIDRTARTQLERILRGGQRMKALIDDLLDMASINAGRFEIQRTRLDAGELMTEAVEAHEAVATERGIRLACACDVQGVPLLADRNRLLQVFGNLIGNALKFCDAGDEVTVRGLREGEQFRFIVADTGPGIADAELPHIFEPYWSGRTTKREGTGLGLFITKAIVEAHGGTIEARSEAGRGSTFTVTLPVAA